MKLWECRFLGRTKGAIGSSYTVICDVLAENAPAARLALYEGYENVLGFTAEVSYKKWVTSSVDPSVIIRYQISVRGSGWSLQKGLKVDSPLELIVDPLTRQKVMAEADDIVWPENTRQVKVTTDTGNTWLTRINGSRLHVCNYFLGNSFEGLGVAVNVEFFKGE